MKKFFTLVLMLFASLHLFANAEIVIYKSDTGTSVTSTSAMTINVRNIKPYIEAGDKILVTVSDLSGSDAYWQNNWNNWTNNPNSSIANGNCEITVAADDISALTTDNNIINFSANAGTTYTIKEVKVQKNDSYSNFEELTLTDKATTANDTKATISNTNCINISDGDIIVVETTTDSHSNVSYYIQNWSTWTNYDNASGNFDGRDFAYKVPSGTGATMRSAGIVIKGENNTNYLIKKVYLAKKIYSFSESTTLDLSSVVTGSPVNVNLTRSITANKWSTIVLPFAMTSAQLSSTFGAGVSVAELQNTSTADELVFSSVTATEANKPYAIKVTSDFSSANITNVTIVSDTPTQNATNWDFVGNYTTGFYIPVNSYYFSDNKLKKSTKVNNHLIKPFRAYFTYAGSGSPALSRGFTIDGQTTGINASILENDEVSDGKIYNLNGQQIAQPSKGLYIKNGKKYIIK